MTSAHNRNVGIAATALLASSATLLCCVLPAVLVSLGAGAALVGLVSAVPQLIWLSEHKALVFGVAGAMLLLSGSSVVERSSPALPDRSAASAQLHAAARSQQSLVGSGCDRVRRRCGLRVPAAGTRLASGR